MFEHFSEINQIGKKYNYEDGGEINGTNLYNGNEHIFSDWHGEMSYYLKEELNIPQLLTVSYTVDHNPELDHSFWHGNIDVINLNQYNTYISDVHGFHQDIIPKRIANGGFDSGTHLWGNYDKPLFFSETGAFNLWSCDNFVETRRNIWQNMFWGVAGTLDWQHEILNRENRNLDIYKRVNEFTQDVDLEGGNWHSGMVKLDNNSQWEYKQSYRDDCISENGQVDLVYLRSGDKEKAFGVITNRRANYYTLGEGKCTENTINLPKPTDEDLQTYGIVTATQNSESSIRLRNMRALKNYKIKYFSPYDQINPIKEETILTELISPSLGLRFPDLDTLGIILFEASLVGENFKNLNSNTTDSIKSTTIEPKNEKDYEVMVYPNPNDGSFKVLIENYYDVLALRITNNLGKAVDIRTQVFYKNQYDINSFNSGIYLVEVVYEDAIIRKKLIIN